MNIGVIFAGGTGARMHSRDLPKQFLMIYNKPIIIYTLEYFEENREIDAVVVACVEEWIPYLKDLLEKYRIRKVRKIVPGGETGQLSIYNGLLVAKETAGEEPAIVLIHDGVRPLISTELLSKNIEAVKEFGSSITAGVVKETIVEIDDSGNVKSVPSRAHSRVAKAPQSFWLEEILAAHEQALRNGENNNIDSCTLMQKYGKRQLHMVDGPYENIKITTPDDYFTMRAIFQAREDYQIYGLDS